jgi:hypothetical protein
MSSNNPPLFWVCNTDAKSIVSFAAGMGIQTGSPPVLRKIVSHGALMAFLSDSG